MENNNVYMGYLFAFMTIVIWSGFIIVSRFAMLSSLTPFDLTFIRYTSAGLLLLPITIKNLHLINKKNWRGIVIMIIGVGAPYLMVTSFGFEHAPASHGILIPTSMPLFIAVLSFFILKERVSKTRILGYLLILSGIIFRFTDEYMKGGIPSADIFFLLAGFLWAIYTVQNKLTGLSPLVATSFVASGSMVLLAVPYAVYQYHYPHELPLVISLEELVYQGILTSIVSLVFYNRAVQLIGPSKTSSFGALVPVLVMIFAVPILHEIPKTDDWIFIAIMSAGVFFASGVLGSKNAVVKGKWA